MCYNLAIEIEYKWLIELNNCWSLLKLKNGKF